MITESNLQELGFVKVNENNYRTHIGGPWYLHAIFGNESIWLQYGDKEMFKGDHVSIWATFTDVDKLNQLINLLKGDKISAN